MDQVIIEDIECVLETPEALVVRCQVDYEVEDLWVPKAVILDGTVSGEGDCGELTVPYWYACKHTDLTMVERAIEKSEKIGWTTLGPSVYSD